MGNRMPDRDLERQIRALRGMVATRMRRAAQFRRAEQPAASRTDKKTPRRKARSAPEAPEHG
jgi:hypothetical protein